MSEDTNREIKKDDALYNALMAQEKLKKIESQVEHNNSNLVKIIEQISKESNMKDSAK
ncbi:hypothetical protein LLG34_00195 [bacterium]|nr:hypothetical protein [bacterium]